MSRIGKKPINIPDNVTTKVSQEALGNFLVEVKGPKGTLLIKVPAGVKVEQKDKEILCTVADPEDRSQKAIWGLSRTLINNTILGVVAGFSKELEINGVGFKAALQGKKLVLNIGFSHPVDYIIPQGIEVGVEKNIIKISGIDKQLVGQTAAKIRSLKKPEPYKGKGIKYVDEVIRRKAGKVVKSA
jgi:large subunit ribosomal protein L6